MAGERELVEKAKKGDILAFEELISAYEIKIFNYCYRMSGNKHDAEDLAQEIFIKVYKNLKTYKGDSSFSTWLYRVAHNTCIDKYRSIKPNVSLTDALGTYEYAASKETQPDEQLLKKENKELIQSCINSLKPEYRSVIILRDIQNYTYQEIALMLDIPLGTVKSYISRGRQALRELIEVVHEGGHSG
mgnify:CR=1 FL=1